MGFQSGKRVSFAGVAVFLIVVACVCGRRTESAPDPGGSTERPEGAAQSHANVVWILLDACRARNLSCYGYERATSPNLDQLASRGVLCEQNFAQGLMTVLSVPSYITGKYFAAHCLGSDMGMGYSQTNLVPGVSERLFPEIMKANGYVTGIITSHPMLNSGRLFSAFDEGVFLPPAAGQPYAPFEKVTEAVLAWFEKHRGEPFALYVHVLDTHFPHILQPPYDRWTDPDFKSDEIREGTPVKLKGGHFTEKDREYLRGLHDGGILYSDEQVGRIVRGLEELGLDDRTLVIIGADHGDALGEDGTTWGHTWDSSDEILRVPLVICGPGIPRGRRIDGLTENTDILPTIVEALSLKTDAELDGKSVLALAKDAQAPLLHDAVVVSNSGLSSVMLLRTSEGKYEQDSKRGMNWVWRVPDDLAHRVKLGAEDATVNRIRTRFQAEVMPRLEAFRSRRFAPSKQDLRLCTQPDDVVNSEAIIDERNWAKGAPPPPHKQWLASRDCLSFVGEPDAGDKPPLTFSYHVPNGRYRLQIGLSAKPDEHGHPPSGILIKAQEDSEFRNISPASSEKEAFVFCDVGVYNVQEESITITVDEADPADWIYFRYFRLVCETVKGAPVSPESSDATKKQLRALGYL